MAKIRAEKSALEAGIRWAVKHKHFIPYFQPIFDLQTNNLSGFEMLSRLSHPQMGVIPPKKFIPIIEQFRLNRPYGEHIVASACEAFSTLPQHLNMSLNISTIALGTDGWPERLLAVLKRTNFSPERLIIEVSESLAINNLDTAQAAVAQLRDNGIKLVLDNFGTGYSGLKYLQLLKFDRLKLDRSFTMTLQSSPQSHKVMESVAAIANNFGLDASAVGIEKRETLNTVRDMGYAYGQGFLFSPALSAVEATNFAANHNIRI